MFGKNYDEEVKETNIIDDTQYNNINKDNDNKKKIFDFGIHNFNNDISLNLLNISYKSYIFDNNTYRLLTYKKTSLTSDNINSIGKFRSVLVGNNNMFMFSPPKSLNYSDFINKYTEKECIAEEIIEGTMINLFFINNKWEISTKTTVGGNTIFFKSFDTRIYNEKNLKSFREMFFEIIDHVKLDINSLNKDYCYSFVIQHTDNRIVLPIYTMNLYLIKVYKIDNINRHVYEVDYKNEESFINILNKTTIKYPIKYDFDTFDELNDKYRSKEKTPFNCLGVMIYSNDGNRTKIRNPLYEELKELRGNNSKLQYHYLFLRKKGNEYIKKYLHYFQEHEELFNIYKKQLFDYTYTLYNNYIRCFIKKEKRLSDYPSNYKNCMYMLHMKYLQQLRPNNKYIIMSDVIDYVNNLDIKQQMYYLNFDMRAMSETNETQENKDNN